MSGFDLEGLLYLLPAILIGFTVHEFSHAYVAVLLGDDTPKVMGRLTFNPLVHIDPIGMLLIIVAGFGWAKPVQINPLNFKNPKNDDMLVSLAGPISNLLLAIFSTVVLKLVIEFSGQAFLFSQVGDIIITLLINMIKINAMLSVFNLFPIPPLDGSHVLLNLVPDRFMGFKLAFIQYGRFALLGLILLGNFADANVLPIGYLTQQVYGGLINMFGLG